VIFRKLANVVTERVIVDRHERNERNACARDFTQIQNVIWIPYLHGRQIWLPHYAFTLHTGCKNVQHYM